MKSGSLPLLLTLLALLRGVVGATEFHVSVNGNDGDAGTLRKPFRTISAAARVAQPGDEITVHQGIYRERIDPPRGGTSDSTRIVYQAAPGERVEVKGSEVVTNWVKVRDSVWQVILPNSFFGDFNPYCDVIHGDWFNPKGRVHHTGAVYLNGNWLTEAVTLEEVLRPMGDGPAWVNEGQDYLFNVAWLRPRAKIGTWISAGQAVAGRGTRNAPDVEGGACLGYILPGDWCRYEAVDFGRDTKQVELRVASATSGGRIEFRLDSPAGKLLGSCLVPHTGGWQSWTTILCPIRPTSGRQTLCLVFRAPQPTARNSQLWFARVDATNTTLWAQFPGVNPNTALVEINVRRTVFYPGQPGRNYITVRGFVLSQAATPWAPPTAEQIGVLGTHWSKGWIIESNLVSYSTCSGIALGKYGDQYDNTSADTATGYVQTIERAQSNAIPWTRENIGHHIVRYNTISHCEQAGIVGSLGAAFSTITGNTIYDIHVRRLFTGAEMAGIKFHGAIDTTIRGNHIYRTCLGLWLDWMAQGTRVSGNLFHDNMGPDLFVEVNHGPFVVDNNLFLSPASLLDMSEGGAYAYNLFAGLITNRPEPGRETPYHPAHSTAVAGLARIKGGADRFYNNIFVGSGQPDAAAAKTNLSELRWISSQGLWGYDGREVPLQTGGNVFCNGAEPGAAETNAMVLAPNASPLQLVPEGDRWFLQLNLPVKFKAAHGIRVTSALLGRAKTPGLAYENPDGSPLRLDLDYFGNRRSHFHPAPGPFERNRADRFMLQVW